MTCIRISFGIVILVLIAGTFSVTGHAQSSHIAHGPQEQYAPASDTVGICSKTMPWWPTPLLHNWERKARLNIFLSRARLKLSDHSGNLDEKACGALLDQLKSLRDVTVLEPTFVTGLDYRDSAAPNLHEYNGIRGACRTLDVGRVYFSSTGSVITDSDFVGKPRSEKEEVAGKYYEATKNIELYDLSAYLGDGARGFLGEGLVVHQLQGPDPYMTCGATRYAPKVLVQIFNAKTCVASPAHILQTDRYHFRPGWMIPYTTPSFYAFVAVSGKLFEIAYDSATDMNEVAQLEHPPFTELFINAIPKVSGFAADIHTCHFSDH